MASPDRLPLDSDWLRDRPLPEAHPHADKNARGRVFAVGGCTEMPGGLLLTAEAALRAGAGKVQAATVRSADGHLSSDPSGLDVQSAARSSAPISPPPSRGPSPWPG